MTTATSERMTTAELSSPPLSDAAPGPGHQSSSRRSAANTPSAKDTLMMVKDRIKLHNLPVVAAGIGFWGFLALIPFTTAMIGLYSLVSDPQEIADQVKELDLPQSIAGIILDPVADGESEVDAAGDSDSNVGKIFGIGIGILAGLWAASGGIKHLMNSLNQSFDEVESRSFVPMRGTALLLTLGAIVFMGLSVFALAGLTPLLNNIGLGSVGKLILQIVRFPLLFALGIGAFSVFYKLGPDHKTARSGWWKGAVVAMCVLIPAMALIAVFSVPITTGSFAALGGIGLSMVALLAMASAILIGGEWLRSEEILSGAAGSRGLSAANGLASGGPAGASGIRNQIPRTVSPEEELVSPAKAKVMTGAAIVAAAFQSFAKKTAETKPPKVKVKKKKTKVKKAKVVKTVNKKDFEARSLS